MTKVKHVWFDVENTLARRTPEYSRDHDVLLTQTLSEITGEPATPELLARFREETKEYGGGVSRTIEKKYGQAPGFWHKRYATLDLLSYFTETPGVRETLEALANVVPISVYANGTADAIERSLKAVNIPKELFVHMVSGDIVGVRKPALEGFQHIIELSGLSPEENAYVGDRLGVDIIPAQSLGMQGILVWSEDQQARYSFSEFSDILTIFAQT